MDSFNKIVSFVLGLVVVIVFLAVITGRFDIRKRFQGVGTQVKIVPTVTPTKGPLAFPTPTTALAVGNRIIQPTVINNRVNTKAPTSIPSTGSPTIILPLLFSALGLGMYLKKQK